MRGGAQSELAANILFFLLETFNVFFFKKVGQLLKGKYFPPPQMGQIEQPSTYVQDIIGLVGKSQSSIYVLSSSPKGSPPVQSQVVNVTASRPPPLLHKISSQEILFPMMSCGLTSQVFLFAQTTTHRRDFIVKEIEVLMYKFQVILKLKHFFQMSTPFF